MPWVFTVLLIAISVGIVGFAGWALRRLFTLRPGVPDAVAPVGGDGAATDDGARSEGAPR